MKDIKGYEGKYAVTSCGKVWSYISEKFLSPRITQCGYYEVRLCNNVKAKQFRVHRLVAETYIDNPENKPEVNHKDENKLNNCINNLEWVTTKENSNYGTRSKRVSQKKSKSIYCKELNQIFSSMTEAQKQTGVNRGLISRCCNGKLKRAGKHPITGEDLHWNFI